VRRTLAVILTMKNRHKFIYLIFLFSSLKFYGQNNNDTIVNSYAILRYSGGLFISMTVTYDDKLPVDLKQLLKNDKTPSKQLKGINSIADEYIFEGFLYLNRKGYQLVTSTGYYIDGTSTIREYIFIKKNYR